MSFVVPCKPVQIPPLLCSSPQQDVRDDCYSARLRVLGVDVGDAREYVLNVENDKGADRYAVGLTVSGG